jgi:hypothetical protein
MDKKILVKYKSLAVKMVQDGVNMLKIAKVNYELIMCDHVETNVGNLLSFDLIMKMVINNILGYY